MSKEQTLEQQTFPAHDSMIDVSTYKERTILEFWGEDGIVTAVCTLDEQRLRWLIMQLQAAERAIKRQEKEAES